MLHSKMDATSNAASAPQSQVSLCLPYLINFGKLKATDRMLEQLPGREKSSRRVCLFSSHNNRRVGAHLAATCGLGDMPSDPPHTVGGRRPLAALLGPWWHQHAD